MEPPTGDEAERVPAALEKAMLPTLLPVVVAPAGATAPSSGVALEIVFPEGAVVRVPPSFEEETLARVVRALGGGR